MKRSCRWGLMAIAWVLAALAMLWSVGAFAYDLPWPSLRTTAAALLAAGFICALIFVRGRWRKLGAVAAIFAAVLAWWLTLKPGNDGNWMPDVDRTAFAEIQGNKITFHNVRNCDYRTETDYTPHWETRTVDIAKLTGVDMAITYWGSPYIAHPIVSFQFSDAPPLCFSIETRKQVGQSYSTIGGIYRQFELIYLVADERDVIRLRTNYRENEDVHLFRLNTDPEHARDRFMEYVTALNSLHDKPRWYNALTTNCTTSIRHQRAKNQRAPWDWRLLLNGKGDEMLYERGELLSDGLSFDELKKRSHINATARSANDAPDFSTRIRAGLPSPPSPTQKSKP